MKLIGIYSPVGRCLQTTFSFTLGQLLARKNKVLYLNFECFSGLGKMLRQEFQADLSDLIYFLHNGDGRFPYRLEGMTQKVNGLDYIPPAFSCLDLQRVEKEEWMALLDELGQSGLYDYVILDLSEVVNGLFDILKRCFRVYTIVREDGFAAAKQAHYEELLTCLNHEDILENTRKCRLPLFRQLPQDLENLTRGELAELVQKLIAGGSEGMTEERKEEYLKIKEEIRRQLIGSMDFTREITDDELQGAIAERLRSRQFAGKLDIHERTKLGKELFFALRGLDILQELIEDEQVTEIMINGLEGIFVERAGRLFSWPGGFETKEKLQDVIQQIVAGCNRTVNEASPIVDARLKNGSRVNVVLDPVALNGPVVTIRRFPDEPIGIRQLVEMGSITQEACRFLESSGEGEIQHLHQRRDGKRENHLSERACGVHSKG